METKKGTSPPTDIRQLIADGMLNEFAAAWPGNTTGFTLKQIAADLYPNARAIAQEVGKRAFVGITTALLLATAGAVFYAVSFLDFNSGYATFAGIVGFSGSYAIGAAASVLIFSWVIGLGNTPTLAVTLDRFTADLKVAIAPLEMTFEQIVMDGRTTVRETANNRLLEWAIEIVRTEQERDAAKHSARYLEKDALARRLRSQLAERYDALALLKLPKKELHRFIPEARRIVAEQDAAA